MQTSQNPLYFFDLIAKEETPENLLALQHATTQGININRFYEKTLPDTRCIHTLLTQAVEKRKPKFVEVLLTNPKIDTTLRYQKIAKKNYFRDPQVVEDLAPLQLAKFMSQSSSDDNVKKIILLLEQHAVKLSEQFDKDNK